MKIQIRKVNGAPMGRPKNPHDKYMYGNGALAQAWAQFEQSVTEHECPGCEEGEAEGELVTREWILDRWLIIDEPYTGKYNTQQIWIVPSPEKVEVKDKLQLYADISFVYTGSALHINNDEGLFIYLDKEEIIKVRDFLNGLLPSPPTH